MKLWFIQKQRVLFSSYIRIILSYQCVQRFRALCYNSVTVSFIHIYMYEYIYIYIYTYIHTHIHNRRGLMPLCFNTFEAAFHDDIIKWKHFPYSWPFVRGIHRWPMDSGHKGQWRRGLMFSLICAWINGWAKIETSMIWDAITLIMT